MPQDATELALEALVPLVADPTPKVLHGSKAAPGVFRGAAQKEKAAARVCLDNGWLEATGEFTGKGRSRKELYRITPRGIEAVLQRSDVKPLLQSVQGSLEALDARVGQLTETLREQLQEIAAQLEPLQAGMKPLREVFRHLVEKTVRVPDRGGATRPSAGGGAGESDLAEGASWLNEVVTMVAEQQRQNPFQRLTLPKIYQRLRAKYPHLTLGQFHDGLRSLQDQKRILLGPYTQALPTLEDPRNALYLDREVKYYVEPA